MSAPDSATASAPVRTRSVRTTLAVLAGVFLAAFAGLVIWLLVDQRHLLDVMEKIQTRALPGTLEQQRLVRNLEAMRLEGERVLYGQTPAIRQQAGFVASLIVQHPGLREQPQARVLADRVSQFLQAAARQPTPSAATAREWGTLSLQLSQLADQLTADGIATVTDEVGQMQAVVSRSVNQLMMGLGWVALLVLVSLAVIMGAIIYPLRQIDSALSHLRADQELPPLTPTRTTEICTIHDAIRQLHHTLQENESIRAGLEVMATTDGLTGLTNRRHFMQEGQQDLARARRYQRPVSVALADLDHFKNVNDRYGHDAGDTVLKAFAAVVFETLRQTDRVCRYGGEEFAFIFPETTPSVAADLAERLRRRFETTPVPLSTGDSIYVTLSMGVVDASALDLEEALRQADHALYAAKAAGRNRIIQTG